MSYFDPDTEMIIRLKQIEQGIEEDAFVDFYDSIKKPDSSTSVFDKKEFDRFIQKNIDKELLDALFVEAKLMKRERVAEFLLRIGASKDIYLDQDPYNILPNNPYIVGILLDNNIFPTYDNILSMVSYNRVGVLQSLADAKYYDPTVFKSGAALFLANWTRDEEFFHLLVKIGADPYQKEYLQRIDDLNLRFPFQRVL